MKKTIWVIAFLILAIVIGFFVGIYLYNAEANEEQMENDIEKIDSINPVSMNTVQKKEIETSMLEEKISVNTQVIEEVYYIECDHLLTNTKKDIRSLVNMTKEKLAQKYPDWEIKEFSTEKVVLYKEEQNYCNQHYILKDVNGFITIYNMDEQDNIKERIEITEIETKYLPEKDKEDLEQGIKVYSLEKLNKLIEDYE